MLILFWVLWLLSRCCQTQHHDDEKRALSREIIVLNNHLMEAKLTIEKLQEDNVRAHRASGCFLSTFYDFISRIANNGL